MQASGVPGFIPTPFGVDAASGYIRAVPTTQPLPGDGAASWDLGFPPETFTPPGSGGFAPDGRDFQGLLNFITALQQWYCAGGPIKWSSAYSATIGGYPAGALVQSTVTAGLLWRSTVDNNTTNPDTGGAGWTTFPNTMVGNASASGSVGFVTGSFSSFNASNSGGIPLLNFNPGVFVQGPAGGPLYLGGGNGAKACAVDINGNFAVPGSVTALGPLLPNGGAQSQIFTSSGTFTVPTGVTALRVICTGAGGGGGGCQSTGAGTTQSGAGAGSGATAMGWITGLTPGAVITVTVGAGGNGGSGAAAGGAGSSSSFGSYLNAGGGGGGEKTSATSTPGGIAGNIVTGFGTSGGIGSDGQSNTFVFAGNGAASWWGGGGRAGQGGGAGAVVFGAGGGGAYDSGATSTSYNGGAGAPGIVVVEW